MPSFIADNNITVTSLWTRWRLKSPASPLFTQPFIRVQKTSKLRVTGLCAGNSSGTGEFPAQMASNAENVSIWWRHHEDITTLWHGNASTPLTISGGNHRSPVDSPHNGRSIGIFYPLVWTSCWSNIWVADDWDAMTSLQWFQYRLSNPKVYWKTQRQ